MLPDDLFGRKRPDFADAHEWLAHARAAIVSGERPWEPVTRDELVAADDAGLLADFPEWLPGQQGLALLGLPSYFGRTQTPLPEVWCERHLQTLLQRAEYRAAMQTLLQKAGAA